MSTTSSVSTGTAWPSHTGSPTDYASPGLTNYYYVFFAVVLCVGALVGFFFWRRRRAVLESQPHYGERQLWMRRRISADAGPEEGLNEHGEAPPPYMPKSNEQGPAVPMQTLSRDGAGLPPDYAEQSPGRDHATRAPT